MWDGSLLGQAKMWIVGFRARPRCLPGIEQYPSGPSLLDQAKPPGRVLPWPGRVLPGLTLLGRFRARAGSPFKVGSFFKISKLFSKSSRGGLVLELWTDNSLPSATVGSNLLQVWCINRSVEETLCCNSNCRMPGSFGVYNTCIDDSSRKCSTCNKGLVFNVYYLLPTQKVQHDLKCVICVMTEIQTIEGVQKRSLLTRGDKKTIFLDFDGKRCNSAEKEDLNK